MRNINRYFTADSIASRLGGLRTGLSGAEEQGRLAAIALIIKPMDHDSEILLIERSLIEGDRWSGQMAFPGGHREPSDGDLLDTAIRETHEEVGVTLLRDDCVGSLHPNTPFLVRQSQKLVVWPFVFCVPEVGNLNLGDEAASAVWCSMTDFFVGKYLKREKIWFEESGVTTQWGYRLSERHFVWGLTFRTLISLFETLVDDFTLPTVDEASESV